MVMMAKHQTGRKARGVDANFQEWPLDIQLDLSTLAAATVVKTAAITLTDAAFLYSGKFTWTMHDIPVNTGIIKVGLCHDDFTNSEIAAFLTAAAPVTKGDKVAREISTRGKFIKRVGVFPLEVLSESLNDGKPIKTKLRFDIQQGRALAMYAMNVSDTVRTGNAHVSMNGPLWGRWH